MEASSRQASSLVARNIVTLLGAQLITWAATLVLVVSLPRYLGDTNLGKLTFATAYTELFALFLGLGTFTYLIKEIAGDREKLASYTFNALAMRLPMSLLVSLAMVAGVNLLHYPASTKAIVYILCVLATVSSMNGVLGASLQGVQNMRRLSIAGITEKVVLVTVGVALLVGGQGVIVYALVALLGSVAGLAVNGAYFVKHLKKTPFRLDLRLWRKIFVGGLPFLIWDMALTVYIRIDIILLSFLASEAVIGWYGAAIRIIAVPVFLPQVVTMAALPALSASIGRASETFHSLARRSLNVVVLAAIPIGLGLFATADKVIGLFHYPDDFANSVPLLAILALAIPLLSTGMVLGMVLIALNRQRAWSLVAVTAACLNPALNLFMIPYFQSQHGNGAIGAAIVSVITEVYMTAMALLLMPKGILGLSNLWFALKCLAAGLAMVVVIRLLYQQNIVLIVPVAAFTYGLVCLALRALTFEEIGTLWGFLRDYRTRTVRADEVAPGTV